MSELNSNKLFEKAFSKVIINAGNACYYRQALYVCFCKYHNCEVAEIRKFLKEHAKTLISSDISKAGFRGTLSRELKVVDFFIKNSRFGVYFADEKNGWDSTKPTADSFIKRLAEYMQDEGLNAHTLFAKSPAEKEAEAEADKAEADKAEADKAEAEKALREAEKAEAEKAGLTVAGLRCYKAFIALSSLSQKNKVLKKIQNHCEIALEQAKNSAKAEAEKAEADKAGVKAGELKKAS